MNFYIKLQNALLTATATVVRDSLNCYEPGTRVYRRDIERAKLEVQNQYESALKAIRERRAELAAAKLLIKETMLEI
ncbi:F0F1 ATP synthase subunit B' domain protein [Cooperia oncophora]